eukprot:SAG31_NODE_46844_length_252_cov_1.653595_1_plen_34_part_01
MRVGSRTTEQGEGGISGARRLLRRGEKEGGEGEA